jgi:hypothetical protein
MVCWYDPPQLVRTAIQMVTATAFARNADRRLSDAASTGGYAFFDYSTVPDGGNGAPRREIVVDYVADTGDGWNSTYAVAYWVTRPQLELADPSDRARTHRTRRGDILVFGGDEVYPVAGTEAYERRLVAPYETALQWTDPPHPALFAVPGNHDWYDNLVAFSERFVAKRWLGGWQTRQERSYFAVKLPHGWWLVGSDVQLESEIDQRQVDFFREVAAKMKPDDRIILCTAEPHWVYQHELPTTRKYRRAARNLEFLERHVFGPRIKVFLSGDLHHYRRYANGSVHKITAGGGGAFLHPTHGMKRGPLHGGFALQAVEPSERTSRALAWRNLLFLLGNPRFGLVTGLLSVLVYLGLAQTLAAWRPGDPLWRRIALALVQTPSAALTVALVLAGFVAFTDTSARWYRIAGGLGHGAVQLLLPILTAAWFRVATASWRDPPLWFSMLVPPAFQLATGWLLGSMAMGVYLLFSLNVLGRHRNEAFSSLRWPDHKSFLRLCIDEAGDLTIHPIGVRRVPRSDEWTEVPGATVYDPKLRPREGGRWTGPHLIERPFTVTR